MIRASVMYPAGEGATFDLDYYRESHMAIVQRVMPGLVKVEIDQALNGPFLCVGHLYFESPEALNAAMTAPDAGEAMADIPNFTNTTPSIQVGLVL